MTTFVVTGSELHDAASWASRIVPAKPVLPLLGGLLLDATDELRMTGFDLDTCGTVTLPAVVKEPGRLLLSARLLAAVAKTVDRDVDVVIEEARGGVQVRCGRSEWTVPSMSAAEYPQLPVSAEATATVDADTLRRALARVLPASCREPSLANLAGARIEPGDDGMLLVATDRYRLAVAEVPLLSGESPSAHVPAELLEAAIRASGSGEVSISCTDQTFGLAADDYAIVGRQVAEEFPRWRQLLPDPGEQYAVVEVSELTRAIQQAQVMAPDAEAAMQLQFDDDTVRVAAEDTDRRAHVEVAVEFHGEARDIGVKPAYLLAALAAMESPSCAIHLHRSLAVLTPLANDATAIPGYRQMVAFRKGKSR